MHMPVTAVPGVAHLVPSVAPLAHTNETKASLSSQRTVSVPVTRRKAGEGPESPFRARRPGRTGRPSGPLRTLCAGGAGGPLRTLRTLRACCASGPLRTRRRLAASRHC